MHGLFNKDCKQIFTMSVTCNTQEQLLTEIHQPPQHFFIINTGIKTILNIFLILLVVSTHTASKINTICDNIHCTCYFEQFQTAALSLSKMDKHAISGFPSWDFTLQKHTRFQCHLPILAMLSSCKPEFYLEHSRFMFKWQCLNKRKKNCAAFFLLLPENIMGVHILNIFLQMSRPCLSAGILLLNVWVFCIVIFNQDIYMSRRLLI